MVKDIDITVINSLRCVFAFSVREEAKELMTSSTTKANSTQNEVTEKLGERAQTVSYWKFELERAIQDMISEPS